MGKAFRLQVGRFVAVKLLDHPQNNDSVMSPWSRTKS